MKRNPVIAIGALLLLIFVLLLFVFQVRKTEVAVVTTFGRYSHTAGPGPHFKWPWPIQSVHKFDQRIHSFEANESKFEQVLTSDGYAMLIKVYVGWNISDPAIFLTRFNGDIHKAENNLAGLIRNAYSGVVGRHPFSHFISTDEKELKFVEIEQEMQTRVQTDCRANTNGLDIAFLGIKQIGLPESVTQLVFNTMKSEREKMAGDIENEGERLASEIRARAEYESVKILTEADAQATRIQGEGEKEAAKSFEVFKQEPELAIFLLKLKALEEFLKNRATLILDENTAPLDLLKSQKPAASEKK